MYLFWQLFNRSCFALPIALPIALPNAADQSLVLSFVIMLFHNYEVSYKRYKDFSFAVLFYLHSKMLRELIPPDLSRDQSPDDWKRVCYSRIC